jgi:DNA repair exonuclease SbcCD nuclease subunit
MGNHDIPSNNLFLEGIHPFVTYDRRVIVDRPQSFGCGDFLFACIPYVPNGRFREALAQLAEPSGRMPRFKAIFCHQEFKNADIGSSIISKNGDEWPVDGDLVISGHIHKYQKIQGNIIYVGSPYQVTFGEDDEKTVSIFEFDWNSVLEKRFNLGMPRKNTYTVSIKEALELQLSDKDLNRLFILDTSIEIGHFKKTEKYKDLQKVAKVIFKPTDKVFVRREVTKKTFRQLLLEYSAKEDSAVTEVLQEVLNAGA